MDIQNDDHNIPPLVSLTASVKEQIQMFSGFLWKKIVQFEVLEPEGRLLY
jgi:hypothetical protein